MATIVGPIIFTKEQYAQTPCVSAQWVKGKKFPWELEIVNNMGVAGIPKTADLIFPIPKK
jgi:hypothetical protein